MATAYDIDVIAPGDTLYAAGVKLNAFIALAVSTSNQNLKAIVQSGGYELTAITYDSDGVITTGTVLWPDGSAGVFTTVTKNATWLTVDAFTITHTDSGKTVTQSLMTRSATGQVTVKPALTVA